ncbi:hypothetical protein DFJ58DRAFT_732396 [Suillus subalutaceus]|uniref:uncharacterized protein n=1 Tax=Suillus subalutaceus TaxID=48586 RepID=UPI001B87D82E|nr:uncharacterized protein DFJ58DRAFT_732396 [Suillus subalutaceus]KAG1841545.1 hypothetical protein DFJ58DRAFT_732396 [Suillus subalutaceus]
MECIHYLECRIHDEVEIMHATTSAKTQKEYIDKLQAEIDVLQKRIGEDESAETVVSRHINLLHHYNEAKDATQLAALKETTVRQIHNDMDLLDD